MRPLLAAAGGHRPARLAGHVCAVCKARKKKCDKTLPSCRNCVRKQLSCVYDYESSEAQVAIPAHKSNRKVPVHVTAPTIFLEPSLPSEANLYHEVHRLIRATGHFVDDVTTCYFRGVHQHLPMVSRTRLHGHLFAGLETPSATLSVLLLTMCLVSCTAKPTLLEKSPDQSAASKSPASAPAELDRQSLYLIARSVLAQVQALYPPSVHLVQAGLLLALYEYAYGDPDKAFASLAGSGRLAYAAGIEPQALLGGPDDNIAGAQQQEAENANTWWALNICERMIYCDVTVSEQPLITTFPKYDVRLPTEPYLLERSSDTSGEPGSPLSVSCLFEEDIGSFGRSAQAAWLVDRVFQSFSVPDWDTRLAQLHALDGEIQAFLTMLIHPKYTGRGPACTTIAMGIRALFNLHCHIIAQPTEILGATHECRNRSLTTLDTAARMVLDIVEKNDNMVAYAFDHIAPSYTYMVQASISHLSLRMEEEDEMMTAKTRLRSAFDQFNQRWVRNPVRDLQGV
ncbi:hypothetical protein GE09DRAFT_1132274 [Coniochaeta sp. 2T2.1]|nr:hypothetical protein GE09DRAFT_1132274 [Coniochaeta sp. 2T2.1]